MPDEPAADPSEDQVRQWLSSRRNWARWGVDDQVGAVNLITAESRLAAMRTVRSGDVVSLSRPLTHPQAGHAGPVQYMKATWNAAGLDTAPGNPSPGWASDYYGVAYHGVATTHLDALCHVWDSDGLFNGRDPREHISFDGATFGGIEKWATGIMTRAILLDVPRFRGSAYVTQDRPVHGWELEAIVSELGLELQPGDAVCVYSGRERWQAANPSKPYGRYPAKLDLADTTHEYVKPGLHASCLPFLRDNDLSTLVWDMLDVAPSGYDIAFTVHGAIHAYGMALVDNALLQPLAEKLAGRGSHEFLLAVSPLVVPGGTGSPVNPLAVL